MSEPDSTVDVAAAVIVQDSRCLITQRLQSTHLGGLWEFPGGKRHPDESLPDCLRRELKEELDLTVEVGEEMKVIQHAYPDRTVRLHFYRCRILGGRPRTLGNQAYRWVSPADLSRFPFPDADQLLIRDLQDQPGAGDWRI
ncbi:MAG: (deoxy)nucleoside triphosphate pyrophosphohydrolase [Nitrospirae bacterium]|nr:(deoxy)nucleoside triphosphate pyrophosphohydrolase [Nitrospirota bacterium]